MREAEVRYALLTHIRDRHRADPSTLIRQELGLCAGRSRVDIAVINGDLAGFEIKSDEDNLVRLAGQVDTYGKVLDRVTLVTTERYVAAALNIIPGWWSMWVARQEVDSIRLESLRCGSQNTGVEPFAVAQLLWRDEAMAHLRTRGLHGGLAGARRWFVWQRLAESVELKELQALVCQTLRARRNWPGGQ